MRRSKSIKIMLILLLASGIAGQSVAPAMAFEEKDNNVYGLAIKGYDPVAYFTLGKAVKGNVDHSFVWNEAKWQFINSEHRDLFAANPAKYAPRHSGYCAVSLLAGRDVIENPEKWKIIDGNLYLGWSKTSMSKMSVADKLE